jgi:hypothetical protein
MTQNGNGMKPKVELNLGQETRLKLTRDKAYVGQNSYGQYYLYGVLENGEEKSFFASEEIHTKILEAGLHSGDEFSIKKVPQQQGRKVIARVEFAVLLKQPAPSPNGNGNGSHVEDSLRDMLLHCVVDADSIIKSAGIQVSDELQKLATTLFIARSRMN